MPVYPPSEPLPSPTSVGEYLAHSMGLKICSIRPLDGGRSEARKFVVHADRQNVVFVKALGNTAGSRALRLIRREASVLGQMPPLVNAPKLLRLIESEQCTLLITDYVPGSRANTWSEVRARRALEGLFGMHARLEDVAIRAESIQDRPNRFYNFASIDSIERFHHLGEAESIWTTDNIQLLTLIEESGRESVRTATLLHCDLAADNVIIRDVKEPVFIDWEHAHLGHYLFDVASMLIRVRADGAWSPIIQELVINHVEHRKCMGIFTEMVVLATGLFLNQSQAEREGSNDSLFRERLRYSNAGIQWLMEILK